MRATMGLARLAVAASVVALAAGVSGAVAQQPAPQAAGARAVVLRIGQAGSVQGILGSLQGPATADAVLTALGEALQAQGVSVFDRVVPGVPVLDVAGQLSTQSTQVVVTKVAVDVELYGKLTDPGGSTWYAHGSGHAEATMLAGPYGGYGGYWGQVPAGTVREAIQRAAEELAKRVASHLEPVAPGAPQPCGQRAALRGPLGVVARGGGWRAVP